MGRINPLSTNSPLRFIVVVVLMMGLTCCAQEQKIEGSVVLLLDDAAVYNFFTQKKASLSYIGESSLLEEFSFSKDTIFTQLAVESERNWTELLYKENSQSRYSYIFQKRDTVLIKIIDKKPWMEVVNRTSKEYDINWEVKRNQELYKTDHSSLEDFYFLWNSTFNSVLPISMESELIKAKTSAEEGLEKEKFWLDSLVINGLLTKTYFEFLAERNRFEQIKIGLFKIDSGMFDALGAMETFSKKSSSEEYHIYLDEFSDFLLGQLIVQHSEKIDEIIGGAGDGYFSQLMLYKYLERQVQEISFAEVDQLLTLNTSKLPNEWEMRLRAPIEKLRIQDPDMELLGLGQKRLTFEELLAEKRGEYLYVDLWAAWCIPCIRSFPETKKLQSDYQDKGIQVIYLSVDKNHKFWEEVTRKYEIAIPERSFIIMNVEESEYLKELNVELIPRYLLFDAEGKLIHPNAPRPESRDIRVLLDSLSSE
ncbi:thioredoxin-like protein [Algoriphagus antarcticus]|uniref:Thioredoxin-like protein n=2 Tax=Algoriphagus antarcticus TaxID=238540 RepID=A0A3E0DNW7_9BACT|nr:thioredoxin-like protein [Algoriphagus antarcticus]